MEFTHLNARGESRMVDITEKPATTRHAVAKGTLYMTKETLEKIFNQSIPKGNVLEVARLAGIMAAKQTAGLIPLCHPLALTKIEVDFERSENSILITAAVGLQGKTGAEMEALTAVSVAGLTIYDMCKAVDKNMVLSEVRLVRKSGGKSGIYVRKE
ncbi:MAG: cyclic pyranopterin monophosphate synthase MoaC [Thermoactinomyces sp.]